MTSNFSSRPAGTLTELATASSPLERALQTTFEQNLETLLGVRFLASEYATSHGGRMDTLGIDENGYPVIIEYKRSATRTSSTKGCSTSTGLWITGATFELLVRDKFGKETADAIEWSAPRLICIAANFTKYDEHAIKQMSRNIELIRYRRFGDDLLMLDLLTAVSTKPLPVAASQAGSPRSTRPTRKVWLTRGSPVEPLC